MCAHVSKLVRVAVGVAAILAGAGLVGAAFVLSKALSCAELSRDIIRYGLIASVSVAALGSFLCLGIVWLQRPGEVPRSIGGLPYWNQTTKVLTNGQKVEGPCLVVYLALPDTEANVAWHLDLDGVAVLPGTELEPGWESPLLVPRGSALTFVGKAGAMVIGYIPSH